MFVLKAIFVTFYSFCITFTVIMSITEEVASQIKNMEIDKEIDKEMEKIFRETKDAANIKVYPPAQKKVNTKEAFKEVLQDAPPRYITHINQPPNSDQQIVPWNLPPPAPSAESPREENRFRRPGRVARQSYNIRRSNNFKSSIKTLHSYRRRHLFID